MSEPDVFVVANGVIVARVTQYAFDEEGTLIVRGLFHSDDGAVALVSAMPPKQTDEKQAAKRVSKATEKAIADTPPLYDDAFDSLPSAMQIAEQDGECRALCTRILETTGHLPKLWKHPDGTVTVGYLYIDRSGEWRTGERSSNSQPTSDRLKHALRDALRAARLDHQPPKEPENEDHPTDP